VKFGIVCDVESKMFIGTGATAPFEKKQYIFYAHHETHFLDKVRIISEVGNAEDYFLLKEGNSTSWRYEESLKTELIGDMQQLESMLAMMGNLKRIHWERPIFEYYPETTEEHERVNFIPSWVFLHEYKSDEPTILDVSNLPDLLVAADGLRSLGPAMSFYREGRNEYKLSRYINAFYNFYFILEGLFANGKFKTNDVIHEFLKSPILMAVVQKFFDLVSNNHNPQESATREQLEAELKKRDQPLSLEGIITYVVKKRGELHHFHLGAGRQQGTPLNNSDYKMLAFMALDFSGNALMHYINEAGKLSGETETN